MSSLNALIDVVAIAPGVGVGDVLVHPVGVGIAGQVEPVPAPALAVAGRGEQAIDDLREGVGGVVARKASTSSGVGGSPIRSNVARRIRLSLAGRRRGRKPASVRGRQG